MVYDTAHASLNYVKYKLAVIQRLHGFGGFNDNIQTGLGELT